MQPACWCLLVPVVLSHGGVSARGGGAHLGVGVYEARGGLVLRRAQCGRLPRLPDGARDGLRRVRGRPWRQVLGDAAWRGSGAAHELHATNELSMCDADGAGVALALELGDDMSDMLVDWESIEALL